MSVIYIVVDYRIFLAFFGGGNGRTAQWLNGPMAKTFSGHCQINKREKGASSDSIDRREI